MSDSTTTGSREEIISYYDDILEVRETEITRLRAWLGVIKADASRGGQQAVYALSGSSAPKETNDA